MESSETDAIEVRWGWDGQALASMLAREAQEVLDLLDPPGAWGRPPLAATLAQEEDELHAEALSCSWHTGRRLVSRARVMAFCGGRPVGFAEVAVLQALEEAKAEKPAPSTSAPSRSSAAETAERRSCRICLEAAGGSEDLELLDSCCACRGSLRYICADCLVHQWQMKAERGLSKLADLTCGLCHQMFSGKALEMLSSRLHAEVDRQKQEKPEVSAAETVERMKAQISTATNLWRQGKLVDAAALFRQTIQGLEGVEKCEAHLYSARHNMSLVLNALGKNQEAHKEVKAARRGFARIYGAEHALSLKAYHNEAMIANACGDKEEARQLYQDTLAKRERVLGPEHQDTLKTRCNLGLTLSNCGKVVEGEATLRQTLVSLERVMGRRHPLSLTVLQNLSLALIACAGGESCKDPVAMKAAAEVVAREAVDGKHLAHGPLHPDTLEGRRDLGTVLHSCGKRSQAEEVWRQALGGMQQALGFQHPSTKGSLTLLRDSLAKHDEAAAAEVVKEHESGKVVSGVSATGTPQWWGPVVVVALAVFTASTERRRGVGRALLGHALQLAQEMRAEALEAVAPQGDDSASSGARAFLERCGLQASNAGAEVMTLRP